MAVTRPIRPLPARPTTAEALQLGPRSNCRRLRQTSPSSPSANSKGRLASLVDPRLAMDGERTGNLERGKETDRSISEGLTKLADRAKAAEDTPRRPRPRGTPSSNRK